MTLLLLILALVYVPVVPLALLLAISARQAAVR